jgi:hypothetical protein
MAINDHFVRRTARIYSEIHGDQAVAKARERVADLQKRGDPIGADMWLRIIVAIEGLRRVLGDRQL